MKTRTNLHAGDDCPSAWYAGKVKEASGGGYYGEVLDKNDQIHYFNLTYTKFLPDGDPVKVGQSVKYAPFVYHNPRAGKVACIKPA